MFDTADRVAVREVLAAQPPLRRQVAELLLRNCNQREVAERLGLSQQAVSRHTRALRRAFQAAGFDLPRRRGRRHGWRKKTFRPQV